MYYLTIQWMSENMYLENWWWMSLFLKAGRAEMAERWHSSLFKISEAMEEKDLDFAMVVFREGTHIDEEEDWSDQSSWHIPWDKGGEIGWVLKLLNLESDSSNPETILRRTRSQSRLERMGVMQQKWDCWVTTRAIVFWTSCRRARVRKRCAIMKRVTIVKSWSYYCHSYRLASLSSDGRSKCDAVHEYESKRALHISETCFSKDILIIIIIIIIIWFGDTVTVTHPTKFNTNSKVRAMSA